MVEAPRPRHATWQELLYSSSKGSILFITLFPVFAPKILSHNIYVHTCACVYHLCYVRAQHQDTYCEKFVAYNICAHVCVHACVCVCVCVCVYSSKAPRQRPSEVTCTGYGISSNHACTWSEQIVTLQCSCSCVIIHSMRMGLFSVIRFPPKKATSRARDV